MQQEIAELKNQIASAPEPDEFMALISLINMASKGRPNAPSDDICFAIKQLVEIMTPGRYEASLQGAQYRVEAIMQMFG